MTIKIADLDLTEVIDAQDVKGAAGRYPAFYGDFFKQPLLSTAGATATATAVNVSNRPALVLAQSFAVTNTVDTVGSYSRSSSLAAMVPKA